MATYSSVLGWKNPKDREAWRAVVHGVAKQSDTTQQLSNNRTVTCSFQFFFNSLIDLASTNQMLGHACQLESAISSHFEVSHKHKPPNIFLGLTLEENRAQRKQNPLSLTFAAGRRSGAGKVKGFSKKKEKRRCNLFVEHVLTLKGILIYIRCKQILFDSTYARLPACMLCRFGSV